MSAARASTPEFEDFKERFAAAWSAPTIEGFGALQTDDVVLEQPMAPPAHGKPAALRTMGAIIDLIPDIRAEVHDGWGDASGGVITFDLVGTLGGSELRWPVVDVFELRDGLVAKRVSYFDPAPLVKAIATRPRAWIPFARSGIWRR